MGRQPGQNQTMNRQRSGDKRPVKYKLRERGNGQHLCWKHITNYQQVREVERTDLTEEKMMMRTQNTRDGNTYLCAP